MALSARQAMAFNAKQLADNGITPAILVGEQRWLVKSIQPLPENPILLVGELTNGTSFYLAIDEIRAVQYRNDGQLP